MKPKIFIGSSVEGLSVAYSIQQNLTYDADVTVWDQGVFELSKTTIESLLDILNRSDFGVFVFTNDDIAQIRKENKNVVRDNVLFEFGLFIGKLGRDRVFFVIPDHTELHLPTDIVGITPGKYDPNREDKSLQAATGPVCHQVRLQIKKVGILNPNEETSKEPKKNDDSNDKKKEWIDLFIERKYDGAIEILEKELINETESDKIAERSFWLAYSNFKINESKGIKLIDSYLTKYKMDLGAHQNAARVFLFEGYFDRAINILENAMSNFGNKNSLILLLAEGYKKRDGLDKAIAFLESHSPELEIELSLEISEMYRSTKEYDKARNAIHRVYLNYPNNEKVRYEYARVAMELDLNEIALYFLKSLTYDFETNINYWGYLSNCCLSLDLYDQAMVSCKKANDLANHKQEWLISNIGNMLKNKGFYSDAIEYLEKGIELNKSSDYAHERLSTSIKFKQEELEKMNLLSAEGRKKIREYNISSSTQQESI